MPLFGELDVLPGERERAELVGDLPQAEIAILAESGHDMSLEQPERLAERVVAYLRQETATCARSRRER